MVGEQWWTWEDISTPNAAARIEAGSSLFFSDEKLNLKGGKIFVREIFHLQVIFQGIP